MRRENEQGSCEYSRKVMNIALEIEEQLPGRNQAYKEKEGGK